MASEDINVLSDRLGKALYRGDLEKAAELLRSGADINWQPDRVISDAPISLAVYSGKPAAVQLAIEAGADVNIKDHMDKTPMFDAANTNVPEIIDILVAAGADVNAESKKRSMPIHEAAIWGTSEIIECLIRHGSPVDPSNLYG